jgi:colanic acid/amylovoran biosynthesis glycosyltransferase
MLARGYRVSVLADEPDLKLLKDPSFDWINRLHSVEYVSGSNPWVNRLERLLPYRVRNKRVVSAEQKLSRENEVVICNFGWFGASMARHKTHQNAAKLITIFHGFDMSSTLEEAQSQPYAELFRVGDLHLPISELWRDKLLALGAPQDKVRIFRMGVDLNNFQFNERKTDAQKPFTLTAVGRFVEKKGLEYAIRAIAHIRSVNKDLNIRLQIVGDGPLKPVLQSLTEELKLQEEVLFLGRMPHLEISKTLNMSDAFMLPSVTAQNGDMEGIPVSLMEAMASGVPVISTRHSGIPELIEHEVNGLLADERDYVGLAKVIERTLADPESSKVRARAARATIEARFNNEALQDELDKMVRHLAS